MADERTDVIVATGGTGVVRAAYSSGNPALGVGPGNVPVFVEASADINAAAKRIVDSKAFDNSVLCTNESVLIAEDAIAGKLNGALTRAGAHILDEDGARRLRAYMFADGHLNTDVVGRDAAWIAGQAGLRVTPKTRVLIAPFNRRDLRGDAGPREAVPGARHDHRGRRRTRYPRRPGSGADRRGRSLGGDPQRQSFGDSRFRRPGAGAAGVGQRGQQHRQLRAGDQPGAVDDDRHGVRRAQLDRENLQPQNLINWARIAYNSDSAGAHGQFRGYQSVALTGRTGAGIPARLHDRHGAPVTPRRPHRLPIGRRIPDWTCCAPNCARWSPKNSHN